MQWGTRPTRFRAAGWRLWFAWRPVKARVFDAVHELETWVWLERVERRPGDWAVICWDYRTRGGWS